MKRLFSAGFLLMASVAAAAQAGPNTVEVEAPGPAGPLRGTMIAAGEGEPVLIIPGSGPTDRDGNNPLGVRAAPYRLLAEALAARGVTTVRIDKRGMFGSAAATSDPNDATIEAYAQDVRGWAAAIRKRTGARCVWLLGHSEGGLVAAAAGDSPDTCGLILVAAPGRKVGAALREQLRANPANAPLLDQAFAAIERLEAGERLDTAGLHPALMPLFAPQVQGMMISLLSHDPAQLVGRLSKPVLVVQGERDIQVGVEDARRLAAGGRKAKLVLLPDVNHVLKSVATADRKANAATYGDPDLPIAPGVVEAVADFVQRGGAATP